MRAFWEPEDETFNILQTLYECYEKNVNANVFLTK